MNLLTLKSIELQVALPRSQDAGKLQDQLSKEGQRFQDSLAHNQVKEDVKNRTTVKEFDEMSKTKNDNKQSEEKRIAVLKVKEEKQAKEEIIDHPYLGSKFDFSG